MANLRRLPPAVSSLAGLTVLLLVTVAASLMVGSRAIAPAEVWRVLIAPDPTDPRLAEIGTIVHTLRVPRTVLGLLVGAALAVAGVLLQALTRNPIAEPRVLGIGAGASIGVVVAIAGFATVGPGGYVWFAMAGAVLAGAAVLAAARAAEQRSDTSPASLALAGAALDAALGSVVVGVLAVSGRTFDEYRFWVVGGLTGRGLPTATQIVPFLAVALLLTATLPRALDALALGDDVAVNLGHRVGLVKLAAGVAAIVSTGAAVAAAGPVAFVGLAVPHLARALVGPAHRWLLPAAALLGPVLLLGADIVGRVATAPAEIPAGIVTALLGAPVLAWLVVRRRAGVAA